MVIQGDFASKVDFKYIEVLVKGCELADGCIKEEDELNSKLNNL